MKKYLKAYDFYIEEGEEELFDVILPEHYVDGNLGDIDESYAIRFLQNELHELLNSFLNGGFSYRGFIAYPLIKDVSNENIARLKRAIRVAGFLRSKGHDFSRSIEKWKGTRELDSIKFASIMSCLYQDLFALGIKGKKSIKKPKCPIVELKDYRKDDREFIAPVIGYKDHANESLKRYLSGLYIHGSLATKDYIKGWSDFDTLAIASSKTLKNPSDLLSLRSRLYGSRRFFYRIDPLQHHGTMIISDYDLQNYCEAYFPVSIFRYSLSVFEDKMMQIKTRGFHDEAVKKLFWFVSYFRGLNENKKSRMNSYDAKVLLHSATLFPALYLESKGKLVYKKFSFDIARKDFDRKLWNVIDYVSSIRSRWKASKTAPLVKHVSRMNPLLSYQLNFRAMDLFESIIKKNDIDVKRIIEGMYSLSENAWSRVKNEL